MPYAILEDIPTVLMRTSWVSHTAHKPITKRKQREAFLLHKADGSQDIFRPLSKLGLSWNTQFLIWIVFNDKSTNLQ